MLTEKEVQRYTSRRRLQPPLGLHRVVDYPGALAARCNRVQCKRTAPYGARASREKSETQVAQLLGPRLSKVAARVSAVFQIVAQP
jgi:hypothetical protein